MTQSLHNTDEIGVGHHLFRKTKNTSKTDLLKTPFFENFIFIVIAPALKQDGGPKHPPKSHIENVFGGDRLDE